MKKKRYPLGTNVPVRFGIKSLSPPKKKEGCKTDAKILAVNMVYDYVKAGKLKRPIYCQDCGAKHPKLHGHHQDYDKPLEVIWLCPICHHKKHPELAFRPAYLCPRCLGPSQKRWQLCQDCLATQEVDGAGYKQSFETEKEEWL